MPECHRRHGQSGSAAATEIAVLFDFALKIDAARGKSHRDFGNGMITVPPAVSMGVPIMVLASTTDRMLSSELEMMSLIFVCAIISFLSAVNLVSGSNGYMMNRSRIHLICCTMTFAATNMHFYFKSSCNTKIDTGRNMGKHTRLFCFLTIRNKTVVSSSRPHQFV